MIQEFDEAAILFIHEHLRNEILTPILKLFSYAGDGGMLWIVLGIALLIFTSTRRRGFVLLLALAATTGVNNLILKPIIARPRPFLTMEGLSVLIPKLSSYSFMSGHSCSSFAAATAMTMLFGKRGAWSFVPATLIAISRPYLGVHYVTDIVCGAAFGALGAFALVKIIRSKTHLLER